MSGKMGATNVGGGGRTGGSDFDLAAAAARTGKEEEMVDLRTRPQRNSSDSNCYPPISDAKLADSMAVSGSNFFYFFQPRGERRTAEAGDDGEEEEMEEDGGGVEDIWILFFWFLECLYENLYDNFWFYRG
jgi:hypothetical protein